MGDPDPIRVYADARQRRDDLVLKLSAIGDRMVEIGELLRRPPVRIRHKAPLTLRYPPANSLGKQVMREQWPPEFEEFSQLIDDYYAAEERVFNAERNLDKNDRKLLGLT